MYPGPVFERYPRVDRWLARSEGRNAGLLTWDGARLLDRRLATCSRSLVMTGWLGVVPLTGLVGLVLSSGRSVWGALWLVMIVGMAAAVGLPVLWVERQNRRLLAELPRPILFGAPTGPRAVGIAPLVALAATWAMAATIAIGFLATGTTGLVTVPYLLAFAALAALSAIGSRQLLRRPPVAVDRATLVADLRLRTRAFCVQAVPVGYLMDSIMFLTDGHLREIPSWTLLAGNTGLFASAILICLANVGQVDGVPRRIRPMVAG